MSDEPGLGEVPRPRPAAAGRVAAAADVVRDQLVWFGLTRLVTAAIAVAVVAAGGWWLLRSPTAPPEAALPRAAAPGSGVATSPLPPTTSTTVSIDEAVTESAPPWLVVHVAGAVVRPGVYPLATGARVTDAIEAAGGAGSDADLDALNLAAPVLDGMRILVPRPGEEDEIELVTGGSPAAGTGVADTDGPGGAAGPVDVNRAGAEELDTLPGVGPATAAAIVTERERNGPFLSVQDLERVPGIGPAKLAAISDLVTT